jgi:butyrate kinase
MISKILAINPGSTSTKIAYFENLNCISSKSLQHSAHELSSCGCVMGQYDLRRQAVYNYIKSVGIEQSNLSAIAGRGGLLRPLKGGTYKVNKAMLSDLRTGKYGEHASNLGAILAYDVAEPENIPAYIINPVVVDEMWPVARYSGLHSISRKSVFHALNHKSAAMRACVQIGKKYEEASLVVVHMGGGISVAAHLNGFVVDVNNALEEGAFSPERSGSLPVLQLAELCFTKGSTYSEVKKQLVGKGGLVSYFGTSDCLEISNMAASGDKEAANVLEAMSYQISKEIGAYSTVLRGKVDAIVLTGGLAHSSLITDSIMEKVSFISQVVVFPGEDEMLAMAEGIQRVFDGIEPELEYVPEL